MPRSRHQVGVGLVAVDNGRRRRSGVSPFLILPGMVANRSQIDSPLPSSLAAPSIWAEAVATPQAKPSGKRYEGPSLVAS